MENNTKRRMLTIGEAARLIEGITEYRIRTYVLHLLFNLGKLEQAKTLKNSHFYL